MDGKHELITIIGNKVKIRPAVVAERLFCHTFIA